MNKYKCEKCESVIETEQTEGIIYCENCGAEINITENNRKTAAKTVFINGVECSKRGEWSSAIDAYTKSLELDPDLYIVHLYRFLAKNETERSNYAMRHLILNLENLDDEDYILFKQKAPERETVSFIKWEGIREKEQETEKQKEREETLIDDGREALKKEDWIQAEECFDKVLNFSPDNSDAMIGKYMAEYHCKDKQELMICAIELSETDSHTWNMITAYLPIAEERQWRSKRREYIGNRFMEEFEKEGEDSTEQETSDMDDWEICDMNNRETSDMGEGESSEAESDAPDETEKQTTVRDILDLMLRGEELPEIEIDEGVFCDDEFEDWLTGESKDEGVDEITSLIPEVRKTVANSSEIAAFRVFLILKDGYIALENGRFDDAKECFDLVIEQKAEADHSDVGSAQIGLLLIEYKLTSMEALKNKFIECPDENSDFFKTVKYYFTEKYPEREFVYKQWVKARKRNKKS